MQHAVVGSDINDLLAISLGCDKNRIRLSGHAIFRGDHGSIDTVHPACWVRGIGSTYPGRARIHAVAEHTVADPKFPVPGAVEFVSPATAKIIHTIIDRVGG